MSIGRWVRVLLGQAVQSLALMALFAGLSLMMAAALMPGTTDDADELFFWVGMIRSSAWVSALMLVPLAAVSLFLVPSRQALLQRAGPDDPAQSVMGLRVLLAALAIVGLAQGLPLGDWWRENLALFHRVTGPGPDPMGLSAIPGAVLFAIPAIATLTLITFAVTSGLAILVRAPLLPRVLQSGVAAQAAFALLGSYGLHRLVEVSSTVAARLAAEPEAAPAGTRLAEWIARQQALGGRITSALLWTLAGYVSAGVAATWLIPAAEASTPRGTRPAPIKPLASSPDPAGQGEPLEPRGGTGASAQAAVPVASAVAPDSTPSRTNSLFDRSTFVVQPRVSFATFLSGRHAAYDIWAYGDTRGGRLRFYFSRGNGVIRQAPAGPDVVSVRPRAVGWLSRIHDVVDAATGVLLGSLKADRPDWEILDAGGRPIARVQPDLIGPDRYVARHGGTDLCVYRWHMGSLAALNPELEIEFAPGLDGRVDRAVLIGLGPLLEQQMRLAHRHLPG